MPMRMQPMLMQPVLMQMSSVPALIAVAAWLEPREPALTAAGRRTSNVSLTAATLGLMGANGCGATGVSTVVLDFAAGTCERDPAVRA